MRRLCALLAAAAVTGLAGCGYEDDNADAARVMAQAMLDAHRTGDADEVCRLMGPALLAAAAGQGGGNCQPFVETTFAPGEPALKVSAVKLDEGRAEVTVNGDPANVIGVVKYASVWRVESAPGVLTPR